LRDHVHGRVYRITYPSRKLVKPAKIAGASVRRLLNNLKLPEDRTRYRTRRELRGKNPNQVIKVLNKWVSQLDKNHPRYEHHLVEALWVTWGFNKLDTSLLNQLLNADDYRARAAAVRALRYNIHAVPNHISLLSKAASDPHGRVRLEAIAAASWLSPADALPIVESAGKLEIDEWIDPTYKTALAQLKGSEITQEPKEVITTQLKGKEKELFIKGAEIYQREGHCITCHQEDGMGLPAAQFPPIANTKWVQGNSERLIKLTLHGLMGPIDVKGKKYPGQVPMTAFKGLSDDEVAAVLTFVRNSFGNKASAIHPEEVGKVREATKDQKGFYNPSEL